MFDIIYTAEAMANFSFILIGILAKKPEKAVLCNTAIFGTNLIKLIPAAE
jgi:hypothetical protein